MLSVYRLLEFASRAWPVLWAVILVVMWVVANEPIYLACALLSLILGQLEKVNRG